ncbi:MAG TPA: S8 family peptidase [Ideonella sp.]|nr:S8 family peptidase [Ideonella sp.]
MHNTLYRWQPAILAAAIAAAVSTTATAGGPTISAAVAQGPQSTGQMIVKLRAGAAEAAGASLQAVAAQHGVSLAKLRTLAVGATVFKLGRPLPLAEARALAQGLKAVDGVEYAEPDQILKADFTPNDPLYASLPQWHYNEPVGGIDLEAAWDTATGTGVVVAVLDTGYRPHADLVDNIIPGYDFIEDLTVANDGDGRDADAQDPGDWYKYLGVIPIDSSWHGTHTAGTVAAKTNNGIGLAGVAFNAKVMPVRVLGKGGGYTSDITDGIIWASGGKVEGIPKTTTPARVMNMSFGGTGECSAALQAAINAAAKRGTLSVVSAGNDAAEAGTKNPANCANVIPVAATGRDGARATYSNFGSIVRIAAPGGSGNEYVWSTLNTGKKTPVADAYAGYQGTSMAAPHVAGVAALIWSKNPSLSPKQVAKILITTARPFPASCEGCGSGIVDANAALAATPAP